jgi:1,4-alpha-glucan branching enzyme
MGVM